MENGLSFRSEQVVVKASGYISRTCLCPSVEVIQETGATGPWLHTGARPHREAALGEWVGLRQTGCWAVRAELPTDGLRDWHFSGQRLHVQEVGQRGSIPRSQTCKGDRSTRTLAWESDRTERGHEPQAGRGERD